MPPHYYNEWCDHNSNVKKKRREKNPMRLSGKIICVLLALIFIFGFLYFIPPNWTGFRSRAKDNNVATVTEFDKSNDEALETNFYVKHFTETFSPMNVYMGEISTRLSVFSSDIQQVKTIITLNYDIDKKNAVTLFHEFGENYEVSLIMPCLQKNTKIVFAQYTAENLTQSSDELSSAILELTREDLSTYGVNVSAVAIEDISPMLF